LLEELCDRYNRKEFIEQDPISIPHKFARKEDVEIAGFFSAIIAWGKRQQILKSANWLMELMDESPADFVFNASKSELDRLSNFYYRTFNSIDLLFLIHAIRRIYKTVGGLEGVFTDAYLNKGGVEAGLITLRKIILENPHQMRSEKHIANILNGSSAKRLNMFLRWMIRSDNRGVDFGIWKKIPASELFIPLDVHTGNSARALGLIDKKQNNWKVVVELTNCLKELDAVDPVKYDFALFGAGIAGVLPR
jgi:uncharacterized protein (TIGR02757 family)